MDVSKLLSHISSPLTCWTCTLAVRYFPALSHSPWAQTSRERSSHPFLLVDQPPFVLAQPPIQLQKATELNEHCVSFRLRNLGLTPGLSLVIICPWARDSILLRLCFSSVEIALCDVGGLLMCYLWGQFPHYLATVNFLSSLTVNFKIEEH